MKKIVLTSLATMGLALGAFAQGGIVVDNSTSPNGITLSGTSGSSQSGFQYYDGTGGIQIWYQNGTTFNLNNINSLASTPGAQYAALSADGFTLATTFTGATISGGGVTLGDLHIAGVTPAGSSITLAFTAWQGAGTSFPTPGGKAGTLAFYMPTADYTAQPTPTSPKISDAAGGFANVDLVLNTVEAVPEPSTFALAGLGAAALLIFRRRK